MNELLRHLIQFIDEKQVDQTRDLTIDKQLEECETFPMVSFTPISTKSLIDDINSEDLSSEQKYFLDICRVVSQGNCPPEFLNRTPGKNSHSGWLTTASKIIRLYITTEETSEELTVLATFIARMYAPMWFGIKQKSSIEEGARHFWHIIQ